MNFREGVGEMKFREGDGEMNFREGDMVPLKAKKLLETKPFLLATNLWSMCHLEKVHFISYV